MIWRAIDSAAPKKPLREAERPRRRSRGCSRSYSKPGGRIYQKTFVDTYAKLGFAKLCDRKTPLTAADLLNDRVIPFYEEHRIPLQRVLTNRGTEYCGTHDRHEY